MKIKEFSLGLFRAFDKKNTITLSELTVLTGPNNYGKSTVLSAMNLFFNTYWSKRSPFRTDTSIWGRNYYVFDKDYPTTKKLSGGQKPLRHLAQKSNCPTKILLK